MSLYALVARFGFCSRNLFLRNTNIIDFVGVPAPAFYGAQPQENKYIYGIYAVDVNAALCYNHTEIILAMER